MTRFTPHQTFFRTHDAPVPLAPPRPEHLSARERAVLSELGRTGECDKLIAHALGLVEGTVTVYLSNARHKIARITGTELMNRVQLAMWVIRGGLESIDPEQVNRDLPCLSAQV